jgi:hypothetical protein
VEVERDGWYSVRVTNPEVMLWVMAIAKIAVGKVRQPWCRLPMCSGVRRKVETYLRLFLECLVGMAYGFAEGLENGNVKSGAHAATGNYRDLFEGTDGSDRVNRRW